jgi:hypothetical protein
LVRWRKWRPHDGQVRDAAGQQLNCVTQSVYVDASCWGSCKMRPMTNGRPMELSHELCRDPYLTYTSVQDSHDGSHAGRICAYFEAHGLSGGSEVSAVIEPSWLP